MNLPQNPQIAVIGLGYVGLPLAAAFARVFPVVGFDIDARRVAELASGHDRTAELSSDALFAALGRAEAAGMDSTAVTEFAAVASVAETAAGLTLTSNVDDLRACNVFIVTVPTPIDEHRRPDLSPLLKASKTVGGVITPGSVVIYESTVYPGATEEDCIPVVERVSGLSYGQDFHAGYSPERINPGDKAHGVTDIVKVTSGSSPEVAEFVDDLYARVITAGTHKAQAVGHHPEMILAGRRLNDAMGAYVASEVVKGMIRRGVSLPQSRILSLGLAFKEDTPDLRNTRVIDIIRELEDYGATVLVHDPVVDADEAREEFGIELVDAAALEALAGPAHGVDAAILAVAHRDLVADGAAGMRRWMKPDGLLFDVKYAFPASEVEVRL